MKSKKIFSPRNVLGSTLNKNTPQLLLPQAFGIGWTINFYPLLHPETLQSLR